MKDETGKWLRYAEENLQAVMLLLEHSLLNPCLPARGAPTSRRVSITHVPLNPP